jgi:hypothetical protein
MEGVLAASSKNQKSAYGAGTTAMAAEAMGGEKGKGFKNNK